MNHNPMPALARKTALSLLLSLTLSACGGGGGSGVGIGTTTGGGTGSTTGGGTTGSSTGGTTTGTSTTGGGTGGGSTTGGSSGVTTTGAATTGTSTGGTTGALSGPDLVLNILPPGANGNSAGGTPQSYPRNFADQLAMYGNLSYAQRGLIVSSPCAAPRQASEHVAVSNRACNYFKSAGIDPEPNTVVGSPLNLVASSGGNVSLRRDLWGVPYIVGDTRAAAMYGFGYASAQDRLWLHDVLRAIGRGRLSEFLGPSYDTYNFDGNLAVIAGYSEAELSAMVEQTRTRLGTLGSQAVADIDNMVAGINAYITSLSGANASARPPEYGALPAGRYPPARWTRNDIVASAILIQSMFASGGGNESISELLLQRLDRSFAPGATSVPQAACRLWRDVRHANDRDATRTLSATFATQSPNAVSEACPQTLPAGTAIWDVDSLRSRAVLVANGTRIPNPTLPLAIDGSQPLAVLHQPPLDRVFVDAGHSATAKTVVPQRASHRSPALEQVIASLTPTKAAREALAGAGLPLPERMSNFLAVTASRSGSGHPIAVMGPQAGYFVPQLLFEVSIRSNGGTPLDFAGRGTVFADLPYMNIGRGVDFAWSATSGYSDLIDTRVSRMCNVNGTPASREDTNADGFPDADGYLFDALDGAGPRCRRFLRRTDTWTATPTATSLAFGGPSQPQQVKRYVLRTHYGPVFATATVNGLPVAISQQRSTFFDELGTVAPFALASTRTISNASRFQQVFSGVTGSFNWLYVDADNVGYIHSGLYPLRDAGAHPELPTWGDGRYEWASGRGLPASFFQSFEAAGANNGSGPAFSTNRAVPSARGTGNPLDGYFEWPGYLSFAQHPAAINPPEGTIANWNNSPAAGWWAADFDGSYGPAHRVDLLDKRLKAFNATGRKYDYANLVEIMADASYADLRAQEILPLLLQLMRAGSLTAEQSQAASLMDAWLVAQDSRQWIGGSYPVALGGLRRDRDNNGRYDQRAAAVLMDAWYPYLIDSLLPQLVAQERFVGQDRYNAPNPEGSAFQYGWYEHMKRVLQAAVGTPGRVSYQSLSCAGGGNCRTAVLNALNAALSRLGGYSRVASWDGTTLGVYSGRSSDPGTGTTIENYDAIQHYPLSALNVPGIRWSNRPTYQQVVEIRNRRP